MVTTLVAVRATMFAAGAALVGAAVWTSSRREAPALRPFVAFVAVVGALGMIDGLAAGDLTTLSVSWVTALVAIPCAFTWFVVEYYGLPHLASTGRKAAFVAPAVAGVVGGTALVVAPSASGSMAGGGPTAPGLPSALGFAAIAEQVGIYYAGGVMLAGVGLLVSTVATYDYLDRRLGATLSFVAVWPWTAYFLTPGLAGRISLESILGITAGGYVLSVVAVGFAVTRGGLFDAAPAAGTLGPASVLSDLDDAVVVVDNDERVVTFNDAAAGTFGVDPRSASGRPLDEVVGADLDVLRNSESIELRVPDGTRQFEASVSPVRDRYDRQPGHAVVVTDVTRERVRSQRLAVLNRVLRHNLRNEMTAIMGRAEVIASDDGEHADSAETILASVDDLMSMSERARQIEEMLAETRDVESDAALADLAERVVAEHRGEHPDASLSVDVDDSLALPSDPRTLTHVLDNLVENALVHNDAPTPVVTVGARRTDDGVRLSVSDNGPGIPEHERAVVESGDETSLDHGSGLGLWAVKWGVIRLGGELSFHDNEPHGTVVTVELPAADESGRAVAAAAGAD